VGAIAIVLAGAFPLVYVLTKLLRRPLLRLGKLLGIGDTAAAGLVATLANSIATFGLVKDMDDRGKVVNIAFAVSAAFVFGDHMGFAAGFAPEMLPAMIAGKLAGGVSAVAVALLLTRKQKNRSPR
jgi:ethanolamine transporter